MESAWAYGEVDCFLLSFGLELKVMCRLFGSRLLWLVLTVHSSLCFETHILLFLYSFVMGIVICFN